MNITGAAVLEKPPIGGHIVYPYTDERLAMEMVAKYAAAGLRNSEGIVLILTPDHCEAIDRHLTAAGFDLSSMTASGQFQCADAATTLASLMNETMPDRLCFQAVVEPLVRTAKKFGKVRAYGEMVSLLYRSNHAAALKLEEFWNELIREEAISLLCTYHLGGSSELHKELCDQHSHYMV